MDAYVIRIYRTEKLKPTGKRRHDSVEIKGVIEDPETGVQESFYDFEQLWNILAQVENSSANEVT